MPSKRAKPPVPAEPKPLAHFVVQLQNITSTAINRDHGTHTSEEIGNALGLHAVTIRRFASSGKGLDPTNLEKLAKFFGRQITVS